MDVRQTELEAGRKLTLVSIAIVLAYGGYAFAGDNPDTMSASEDERAKFGSAAGNAGQDVDRTGSESGTRESRPTPMRYTDELLDYVFQTAHDLYRFSDAVEETGLAHQLEPGREYTIFAPSDDAFRDFENRTGNVSTQELRAILRNHIAAGRLTAAQAARGASAELISGETVKLAGAGDTFEVGNAKVVEADLETGALTVHTIDSVLAPAAGTAADFDRAEAE